MWEEKFKKEYDKLNTAQKEAVDSIYWPIMVVAWPGTGKTQIIALRTANIILKTKINPENILITTFTDAWVIAIKKRLVSFLGSTWYKVTVSTIHSFTQDVIKTFPEKFIEFKLSSLIDEVDSLELLREITDKLTEDKKIENLTSDYDKYFYLRDIKSKIWILKQEWVNYEKLDNLIEKQKIIYEEELNEIKPTLKKYEQTKDKQEKHIKKLEELNIFYEEYNKYLRTNELYDFNDMINFVLEKFETDEELRLYYAETFQFIMLDEYQDTNNPQNRIVELIMEESENEKNIMVVWDDDQSIYRFQWANIENMLDFSSKYKDTNVIVLKENYRSNQAILDLAHNLIQNNNERLSNKLERIQKELIASSHLKNSKNTPILYRAISDIEEENYIISQIKTLLNNWEKLEEIAIITRQNSEVAHFSNLLQKNNIEVESKLKSNILDSAYINYILNYLEIIDNPYSNEEKLINIMRAEISWIDSIDIFKINRYLYQENYSRKRKLRVFDIISDFKILDSLGLENIKAIEDFVDNLRDFSSNIWIKSITEFTWEFLQKIKILEYLEKDWNFEDLEDFYTLLNKIKDWNKWDKTLNIKKILEKINLYKTYNYIIQRQILTWKKWWVQVMTAHSSKWLEFNNVFIPSLYTWNWDSKRVIDKLKLPAWIVWDWIQQVLDSGIEEDRRLFFVAITRAKDNLHLSFPAWKANKVFIESQFINEITWFYEEKQEKIENKEVVHLLENNLKNNLIKYSNLELEYIKTFLETYKLTPSDLNTFLEDPIKFLHNVVLKYPFEDNKYTIFGNVYHRTLELFYLKYQKEWVLPDVWYLTWTFKLLIEKEVLTPEELENALKKWVEWLEWYYENYKNKLEVPVKLEYSFRNKNLIFENIPLSWKIDKIEKIWENSFSEVGNKDWNTNSQLAFFKDLVSLIDYKTWKIKSIWEIKGIDKYWNKKAWEWKYFRQLLFYKLLCEVDNEFNSKFDIWSVAIDFVEWKNWQYKVIEVEYSEEEYEYFKNELRESWNKISNIEFWRELLKK